MLNLSKLRNLKFSRSLAFILTFFISFSFVSNLQVKKAKAFGLVNPVTVEITEKAVMALLGSLGVTVSVPVYGEFIEWAHDNSVNNELDWTNKGLMDYVSPRLIQGAKDGYVVSKEFVNSVVSSWNDFINSERDLPQTVIPGVEYYTDNATFLINSNGVYDVYFLCKDNKGLIYVKSNPFNGKGYETFYLEGVTGEKPFEVYVKPYGDCLKIGYENGWVAPKKPSDYVGFKVVSREAQALNYSIDSNSIKPLSDKQGIYLPMPIVNSIGSTVNPQPVDGEKISTNTTFPVGNIQTGNLTTTPVTDIPKDVAIVGNPADVEAIPWDKVGTGENAGTQEGTGENAGTQEGTGEGTSTEKIDFSPFLELGKGIGKVFPFCVPFDLVEQIKVLNAPIKEPQFTVNLFPQWQDGTFEIDLTKFEVWAKIMRFFIIISYSVILISKTRDWIRG